MVLKAQYLAQLSNKKIVLFVSATKKTSLLSLVTICVFVMSVLRVSKVGQRSVLYAGKFILHLLRFVNKMKKLRIKNKK